MDTVYTLLCQIWINLPEPAGCEMNEEEDGGEQTVKVLLDDCRSVLADPQPLPSKTRTQTHTH